MQTRCKLLAVICGAAGAAFLLFRRRRRRRRVVVITGACGNLGSKLAKHLWTCGYHVIGIEHKDFVRGEKKHLDELCVADVSEVGPWIFYLNGCDCLFHFSAVNPYPNASWRESEASMAHSCNVMVQAERCGVRRVVVASSNHVMGGYKDDDGEGLITPKHPPKCGTRVAAAAESGDAVAYAAAKLAAEQIARALGRSSERTTFIVFRIGWCQPGENVPATLSPGGVPPQFRNATAQECDHDDNDEIWFKNMWLSNQDFLRYATAAIDAPVSRSEGTVTVNAMSANKGARWSLTETENLLGLKAVDDVWRER